MLQVTHTEEDLRLLEAADIAEKNAVYDQRAYIHDCKTPACLLGGYALAHPATWVFDHGVPYLRGEEYRAPGWHGMGVCEEFDVTPEEARLLFGPDGCDCAYRDGKKAATYVREFVANRVKARLSV